MINETKFGAPENHSDKKISFGKCVLSLLFSFTLMNSTHAYASQYPVLDSIQGMKIVEGSDMGGTLTTYLSAVNKEQTKRTMCNGVSDPQCKDLMLAPSAYLIPCSPTNTLGCIEEVYAVDKQGKKFEGKFVKPIGKNQNNFYAQALDINLVTGEGSGGLWEFSGLETPEKKNLYVVQVNLAGGANNPQLRIVNWNHAAFAISPVSELVGNFSAISVGVTEDSRGLSYGNVNSEEVTLNNCVNTDIGICYARASFPENYRFGLKVKLPDALSGWFHGRLELPTFNITRGQANSYSYQIEAAPVVVPNISARIPQELWTPEFKSYVEKHWPMSNGGSYLIPGNFGILAQELTKLFLPMINDKATNSAQIWQLKTLGSFGNGGIAEMVDRKVLECSADARTVSGIVTTNSTVYTQGPPRFNAATATLDYSVLSPHYDEKGAENLGSYDLVLDSTVARCIYGFSNAPIRAEIEVFGADGNTKVATKVLGERDGRMYLSAKGFTFSEPVIKVKLLQEKVAASPVVAQKKKSITCVKGKTVKKVAGVNPKCPTGFRKR